MNELEARAVGMVLASLLYTSNGLQQTQVGVVTPYKAQERLLHALHAKSNQEGPEVATIDSFQGREKEVVVVSCVRANAAGTLGFLADARRMNVAITRARRGLIMLGHPPTLQQKQTAWGAFCSWADDRGLIIPLDVVRQAAQGSSFGN